MIFKIYKNPDTIFVRKDKSQLLSDEREYNNKHLFSKCLARSYITEQAITRGITNLVSLGSGDCVSEYYLSQRGFNVIATDNNPECIVSCKENFHELECHCVDFVRDLIPIPEPALVYFMGSSYVMSDEEFIRCLKYLRYMGVKTIIDCEPCVECWQLPEYIIGKTINNPNEFHGYVRTRRHYDKIFKLSGWKIVSATKIGVYNFVVTLEHA